MSASYKQYVSDECTYNIQSRQKHNMLSLLHAACLKLLVFFYFQHASALCGFFRLSVCVLLKWIKKSSPGTPSLNGVGILFSLTYRPIISRNFFFGEAEAPFLHHLKTFCNFSLHGRGEQMVDPKFGFLSLSFPSHV